MTITENEQKIIEAKTAQMMNDKTIMDFVKSEALEKVASELQTKGLSCTAKAVEILSMKHKNIELRVKQYMALGLMGCMMAQTNQQ
jgi:hypothetical protein